MVGLTPKQKEELNSAIYEYLIKHKYAQAATVFDEETGAQATFQQSQSSGGMKDILENKWTTVVKLKR